MTIFGNIGGLWTALSSAARFLVALYAKKSATVNIVDKLYHTKRRKKLHNPQKQNCFTKKKQYNSDSEKEFRFKELDEDLMNTYKNIKRTIQTQSS